MPKQISLKGGKKDGFVPGSEDGEPQIHLSHHHLMKMKHADGKPLAGRLKAGDEFEFHGKGTVARSSTDSSEDGEKHSATITLHKGAMKMADRPDPEDDARSEIRSSLEKAYTDAAGNDRDQKNIPASRNDVKGPIPPAKIRKK